jgi:hypothetical protein
MSSTTTIVTQSYLTIRATDKGVGVFYADTNPQEAPAGFGKTLGGSIARFRRRTGPVQPSRDLPSVQHLKTKRVPFVNLPEKKSQHQHAVTEEVMAQVQWLKPEQAAEIEFVERTPHGRLRHASFRRLLPRSGEK